MFLNGIMWLSFVCVLTLLGNVLVILAVYREISLHCATYYYVVSLAIADLCVGIIVIPLAISFELLNPPPPRYLCTIWHISDVGASTASILALCVIALDRYIAITSPISYSRSFIGKHSSFVIAAIWFCSAFIAGPLVIILGQRNSSKENNKIFSGERSVDRCEFPSDPIFVIVSSSISFYVPLIIMVFVYGKILIFARKQMEALRQGFKQTSSINDIYQSSSFIPRFRLRTLKRATPSLSTISNLNISQSITLRIHKGKYCRSPSLPPFSSSSSSQSHGSRSSSSLTILFLRRLANIRRTRNWSRFSRDHKATKVLGIVMGVFIACWLPFFVFILLTGVFHLQFSSNYQEQQLFRLFTWLGYTNSALNFLVYVLTSREFRLAFIKLLCRRRYIQRSLLTNSYKQQQQIQLKRISN